MKRIVLVWLAACAAPAAPEPDRAPTVESVSRVSRVVPLELAPPAPAPRPAYEPIARPSGSIARAAVHGDAIRRVAATDDGTAAVSADPVSVRLWPTLDGTREPVIVAMRTPRHLAIAHVGAGFVIAGLDEVGQLELVRTTGDGVAEARIAVTAPRPFVTVSIVAGGVIAERDDHAIAVFDQRGTLRGELVPAPGERIVDIAARRDRVLVLVARNDVVYGRWLELGARVAWGEQTLPLPIDARPIALAPDGERIGATRKRGRDIVIVALARGRVVESIDDQDRADVSARGVGFLDDATFVFEAAQGMAWSGAKYDTGLVLGAEEPIAIVDGQIVVGRAEALGLISPAYPHRSLGYRNGALGHVLADGDGWLASTGQDVMKLDAKFHTERVYDLGDVSRPSYGWGQLTLVDTHTAIAYGQNSVFAIDLDGRHAAVNTGGRAIVGFEPHTKVLASYAGTSLALARYDTATKRFGKLVPIVAPANAVWHGYGIVLLDPGTSGNVAALVDFRDDSVEITDIAAFDPDAADPFTFGRTRVTELTDEQRNVSDVRMFVRGALDTRVASPDGTLVAELANDRLVLHGRDGRPRWIVPSHGATAVAWSNAGELVVVGAGLAHVDLASGALLDRTCGRRFGLWDEPVFTAGSARLCEAP